MKKMKPLSYERKKSLYGYGFISVWMIGFVCFFARPLVMAIQFSVSKLSFLDGGYSLQSIGLAGYERALFQDADFIPSVVSSVGNMLRDVPLIVIMSLLIAVLLNEKFFGRTFFRSVFFTPVIVTTGVVISILKGDNMAQMIMDGSKSVSMLQATDLKTILVQLQLPPDFVNYIFTMVNSLFDLLWKSGIQILLFLAALQTIPPSVYEATSVEGASGWDNFWKITIPMVSPMILLAVIYTIIDSFTDYQNMLMRRISELARAVDFSYSSTLAILYFIVALVFIAIVYFVMNKFIFESRD
ncbi:MAG: sugar ABC transporter permease [Oscillospiraceae bacterium]